MFGSSWKDTAPIYNIVLFGQIVEKNCTWDEVEKRCKKMLKRGYRRHNVRILQTVHNKIPEFIK